MYFLIGMGYRTLTELTLFYYFQRNPGHSHLNPPKEHPRSELHVFSTSKEYRVLKEYLVYHLFQGLF